MERYGSILGSVDSAFYFVEKPETPMNIGALTIYEGIIPFDDLVNLIDSRLFRTPRYLQRIVQPPLNLGQPTWIPDPAFYIRNHIKEIDLPAPGTEAQLKALAGELLSRTLPRDRPLWEIHVINGLPGHTAIFFKVHHCMVDGLAAIDLFTMLMDLTADQPPAPEPKPLYDPPELPDPITLTLDAFSRDWAHRFALMDKIGKEVTRLGAAIFDPAKRLPILVSAAHLVNDNLKPIRRLPINGANRGDQGIIWHECLLSDVHAIRKPFGATVNDVMLAVYADAIERYSMRYGNTDQRFLRVLVPVNLRNDDNVHEDAGNRISVLPIDIPFHTGSPLERLRTVTKFSTVMKESGLSLVMDMVLTVPSLMPSTLQPLVWEIAPAAFSLLAHTWCTNVAAAPIPVYMMGHVLEHIYGYFPLNPSMGLAAVVVSYNGRVTMTLVYDHGIVQDPAALEQDIHDAYADLCAVVGIKPAPIPVDYTSNPPGKAGVTAAPVESAKPAPVESVKAAPVESVEAKAENEAPEEALEEVLAVVTAPSVAPSMNGHSSNGHAVDVKAVVTPTPVAYAATATAPVKVEEVRYRLFSEEWAQQFRQAINTSTEYRRAGANWTSGSLVFVMDAAPRYGFDQPSAVFLDLYRGVCRDAHTIPHAEAPRAANFVIAGDYQTWMELLRDGASPLRMLTTGRLRLQKGILLQLIPHTRSANELVVCARHVPWK